MLSLFNLRHPREFKSTTFRRGTLHLVLVYITYENDATYGVIPVT